jgi:hypothetical protein
MVRKSNAIGMENARRTRGIRLNPEFLNQLINFFWTILCFTPVIWFWKKEGINGYFYSFIVAALLTGAVPKKILDLLMLSSGRRLYENLGVRQVRKFVQNGDVIRRIAGKQKHFIINDVAQARRYLKTIAMYERFHWVCCIFFLLTALLCFIEGEWEFGFIILLANLVYNLFAILLQQYNKIRIKRITGY